jgi:integrase
VSITKSVQRIDGTLITTSPKTRAGARRISLPDEVLSVLKAHQARQTEGRLRMGSRWNGGERVFTSRAGRPLAHSTVEWLMQHECQRLSLPHLTPHGLRHLHASLLLSEGLSLPEVSQRLGHAHPGITMAVYAHALKRDDMAAAEAMARVLGQN